MSIWKMDITGNDRREEVLKRLDALGFVWAHGQNLMEWSYHGREPLTIPYGKKDLYHGGGGDIVITEDDFLAKPINFALIEGR